MGNASSSEPGGGSIDTSIGGYFEVGGITSGLPVSVKAALVANNKGTTYDIFKAQDNSVDVFTIADGGNVNIANLTASKVVVTDGSKNLSSSSVASSDLFTPVLARATNSSTTITGSPATIVWSTETFDVGGYSTLTSDGLFTASSVGYFEIRAQVAVNGTFSAGDRLDIRVIKNGSTQLATMSNKAYGSEGTMYIQVSDIVQLSATDTLSIEVACAGTSPSLPSSDAYNNVIVKKISN
jgi:hypothetical protein